MWTAVVIVVASVVVTVVACLVFGRSRAHSQADDRDADSRGFLGAVVSGLFIVALAFYMVIVWEENGAAEDGAAQWRGARQTDTLVEVRRENSGMGLERGQHQRGRAENESSFHTQLQQSLNQPPVIRDPNPDSEYRSGLQLLGLAKVA